MKQASVSYATLKYLGQYGKYRKIKLGPCVSFVQKIFFCTLDIHRTD